MKNILLSIFTLIIISCNNNSSSEEKISKLEKTNDSLKTILDTLKTKFIFDHAFIKHFPGKDKVLKVGEKYKGEIFFVAYNDEDRILFSQSPNSENFDTLSVKSKWDSSYIYEAVAKNDTNKYFFKPLINDKESLKYRNSMFGNGIIISDLRIIK